MFNFIIFNNKMINHKYLYIGITILTININFYFNNSILS